MTACGIVIGAPRSGTGKTTLTMALIAAFRRRGVAVRAAKSGPDYIDPAFHAAASGAPVLNLDSWAMPPAMLGRLAADAAADASLLVIESAMGLFDGVAAPPGRSGAAADLATGCACRCCCCWTYRGSRRRLPRWRAGSPCTTRRSASPGWC